VICLDSFLPPPPSSHRRKRLPAASRTQTPDCGTSKRQRRQQQLGLIHGVGTRNITVSWERLWGRSGPVTQVPEKRSSSTCRLIVSTIWACKKMMWRHRCEVRDITTAFCIASSWCVRSAVGISASSASPLATLELGPHQNKQGPCRPCRTW
jgi:hypothetical protein